MSNLDIIYGNKDRWYKNRKEKLTDFFKEIFKDQESDIQMKFIYIVGRSSYGEYMILRDTLDKKKAYLIEFQEVIVAL